MTSRRSRTCRSGWRRTCPATSTTSIGVVVVSSMFANPSLERDLVVDCAVVAPPLMRCASLLVTTQQARRSATSVVAAIASLGSGCCLGDWRRAAVLDLPNSVRIASSSAASRRYVDVPRGRCRTYRVVVEHAAACADADRQHRWGRTSRSKTCRDHGADRSTRPATIIKVAVAARWKIFMPNRQTSYWCARCHHLDGEQARPNVTGQSEPRVADQVLDRRQQEPRAPFDALIDIFEPCAR